MSKANHGTLTAYHYHGCRCQVCKDAWNAYRRKYRKSPEQKKKHCEYVKAYTAKRKAVDHEYREHRRTVSRESSRRMRADPNRWAAVREKSRKTQAERRAKIAAIKLERGCCDCGYKAHHAALDFDHVSGEKAFTVSRTTWTHWDRLLAEIAKCVVRCSNCHRIRTHERLLEKLKKKES